MEDGTAGKINPDLQPNQHVYRRSTGVEKQNKMKTDVLRLKLTQTLCGIIITPPPPPRAGMGSLPYWPHYDLLGLFLSLMGPAQRKSGRFNFFLPLTAVYIRWSFTIGGNRKRKNPRIQNSWPHRQREVMGQYQHAFNARGS